MVKNNVNAFLPHKKTTCTVESVLEGIIRNVTLESLDAHALSQRLRHEGSFYQDCLVCWEHLQGGNSECRMYI